jgi:uncharacterized protein (DUF4415 family)
MTDEEIEAAALSDPDNPPWTDEMLAGANIELPPLEATDDLVRLHPDLADAFRALGPDWRERVNAVLRDHLAALATPAAAE